MSAEAVSQAMMQLVHTITKQMRDKESFCMVGVNMRGYVLAHRIAAYVQTKACVCVPVYMPDAYDAAEKPVVILVTDVLGMGEAELYAVNAAQKTQKFSKILLATLVDVYNQRSVPLHADFLGKRLFVSDTETITIALRERDSEDAIWHRSTK